MATIGANLHMKNGKLTFKINKEKVYFNVFQLTNQPPIVNSYHRVEIMAKCMKEVSNKKYLKDQLEAFIIHDAITKDEKHFL